MLMENLTQPPLERVERIYRLPTSLSIAYARVEEMLPGGWILDADKPLHWGDLIAMFDRWQANKLKGSFFVLNVGHPFTLGQLQERARLSLDTGRFHGVIDGWRVSITKSPSPGEVFEVWRSEEAVAIANRDGEPITPDGTELREQAREALRERMLVFSETRRLAVEAMLHSWLTCELIALTPTETMLIIRAKGYLTRVADYVERVIVWLWRVSREKPDNQALSAIEEPAYPTDPNDPRLVQAGVRKENRELIAFVNRGKTVAKFVCMRLGENDSIETNKLNQRLHRLRKKHPGLIVPARK